MLWHLRIILFFDNRTLCMCLYPLSGRSCWLSRYSMGLLIPGSWVRAPRWVPPVVGNIKKVDPPSLLHPHQLDRLSGPVLAWSVQCCRQQGAEQALLFSCPQGWSIPAHVIRPSCAVVHRRDEGRLSRLLQHVRSRGIFPALSDLEPALLPAVPCKG